MSNFRHIFYFLTLLSTVTILTGTITSTCNAFSGAFKDQLYDPGYLKPIDSTPRLKVGQSAPDFTLKSLSGKKISMGSFEGKKNVLISFIPAAWTPICSDQWPGYNIAKPFFDETDTALIGISVDNIPSLFAWTRNMGKLWFEVLSDFWPHGEVADRYGVLRRDGTAERALFLIDKRGILRFIHIGDINERPDLEIIVKAMRALKD